MVFYIKQEKNNELLFNTDEKDKDTEVPMQNDESESLLATINSQSERIAKLNKQISDAMNPLLDQLDHAVLNDVEGLESPTIEVMCAWFWRKLESDLPGLFEITIYETPTARCSFRGEF